MRGVSYRRQEISWMMGIFLLFVGFSVSHCQCGGAPAGEEKEGTQTEQSVEKSESVAEGSEPLTEQPMPEESNPPDTTEQGAERVADAQEIMPESPAQEALAEILPESPAEGMESTPEMTTPAKIGDPCKSDADCGGEPLRCVREEELPSFPFPMTSGSGPPGGYCVAPCMIGGEECPPDAVCYVPGAASGVCLKRCQDVADCRLGYLCENADGTDAACMPEPCKKSEPSGVYSARVLSRRVKSGAASCIANALPMNSSLNLEIAINGARIRFTFGSKPRSPLPVTWPLEGAWSSLSDPISAQSTQADGSLTGRFTHACLFYGQLAVIDGACEMEYEVAIHLP
jgi:hypothetical protein